MSLKDYAYGTAESFDYIAGHISGDIRYVKRGCGFTQIKDREFAMEAIGYFHRQCTTRRTAEQFDRARSALPDPAEPWRQGMTSHQLVIWPDKPDPEKTWGDAYAGKPKRDVGDFKHGVYTWFFIMAHAFFLAHESFEASEAAQQDTPNTNTTKEER